MKYVKELSTLRRMGVAPVLAPGLAGSRLVELAAQIDAPFRKESLMRLEALHVHVEGTSVAPLAFVDGSAGLGPGVDNAELAFLGTPVLQMYVRSWLTQHMTGYSQKEVVSAAGYLLSPSVMASARSLIPEIRTHFLASEELQGALLTSLETQTPDPRVEALLSRQVYALTGALYVEQGLHTALEFVEQHVAGRLVDQGNL